MENRELIIPARLDSKDAAAGLRAIEESAHVADDMGQAADAASSRFRKAHESVQAAAREYLRLTQSLQQAAGEAPATAGVPIGAGPRPDEWLDSKDGLLAAGARRGGREDDRPGEPGGNSEPAGSPAARMDWSNPPQGGASTGADRLAGVSRGLEQGGWDEMLPGILAGTRDRESGGKSGSNERLTDPEAPRGPANPLRVPAAGSDEPRTSFEGREILAQARGRQGSVEGAGDLGAGLAGRMAGEAASDYAEWINAPRDGNRGEVAINRPAGPAIADGEVGIRSPGAEPVRRGDDPLQGIAGAPGGLNPLEGVWRARAASATMPSFDRSSAEGPAMRQGREPADSAAGGRGSESRLGGASIDVIERLLREQNELIRQDLQRNAHPPIAAPPPMRGGGIRM